MTASNSFARKLDPRKEKLPSVLQVFLPCGVLCSHLACRVFDQVLKQDRLTYGVDDDYEIGDTTPSDLQQEVDDIILGAKDGVV